MNENSVIQFKPELHKTFLRRLLDLEMPSFLSSMDTHRSVLLYFAISGLDVLNDIENLSQDRKQEIIDWVYSLQVKNVEENASGFQGSTTLNIKGCDNSNVPYKWCHIANTYSSLAVLLILGDDLSRVYRTEILKSIQTLQLPDGSFKGAKEGAENDMRFVFCAACICYILDDWSCIDVEKMVNFILKSISYDGGIGQGPELESHSGSTFCGLAALALSKNLNCLSPRQINDMRRWLVNRVVCGFNGRPNKPEDTCYSFWTGGALKILDAYQFIEADDNNQFILMTQDKYGGFAKWVNTVPDPMHTYLGLAGLSLMKFGNLSEMFCELNMTKRTHKRLKQIQAMWK